MEQLIAVSKKKKFSNMIFLLFLFTVPCILLFNPAFENDTYWLINTGKFIMENGFPHTEPFTMHSGLFFTPQQWLTTVIFYQLYNHFGSISLYIMVVAFYLTITAVVYRLSMKLSDNNKLIAITVAIFTCIFLNFYMVPRPQIFSILIFILEIYLLESFIKSNKVIYLFFLPLLSVLLVNLHSAMWLFFFVLYVPFIIDAAHFKCWIIKTQGYKIIPVTIALVVSFLVGFLNPYSTDNVFYVLNSYGNDMVNASVSEMNSPNFKDGFGLIMFVLILAFVLIHIVIRGNTRLRYVLISIGTLYMGLSSVRSMALFIGCALPFIAYYMKDITIPKIGTAGTVRKKTKYILIALLILIVGATLVFKKYDYTDYMNGFRPIGAVDYINKNVDKSKMRLYNDYNTGGYIEFEGITTFIDSRGEVFLKSLNKKDDIIIDYLKMRRGSMHYKDFIKKYNFTHYLVSSGDTMDTYLSQDPDYKKVYSDKSYLVYESIK